MDKDEFTSVRAMYFTCMLLLELGNMSGAELDEFIRENQSKFDELSGMLGKYYSW